MELSLQIWKTWEEINASSAGRQVYLYGRSEDWVHKALPKLVQAPAGIVDREVTYHKAPYLGLEVLPIEDVVGRVRPFFIITAGEYSGIVATLMDYGFTPGEDFACSPDFKDYATLQDLQNTEERILFSSPDYFDPERSRGTSGGGGLFVMESLTGKYERVAKGSYRQFVLLPEGGAAAVEFVRKRIDFFDENFEIKRSLELDKANYCGLALSQKENWISTVNAGTDEIETFELTSLSHLESRKFSQHSLGRGHHLNDCVYDEAGVLYCSFFSYSGSFKMGNFDGGIAAITPLKPREPVQLASDLWKPHSPFIETKGEQLWILDSMRGKLRTVDGILEVDFPGFVRGLDEKNGLFAIGQSQNMYFAERQQNQPTMVDSGIHLLERHSIAYRMLQTPTIMNIHQVAFLDMS